MTLTESIIIAIVEGITEFIPISSTGHMIIAEKLLSTTDIIKKPHELLSNRELEIFKLLALGKTITQIADSLSLALTTISTHRSRIMGKLGLSTNSELTRYAIAYHIISDIDL